MTQQGPDVEDAYDEMFGLINSAWEAGAPAVNGGTAPPIEWPNMQGDGPPLNDGNAPWARVSILHDPNGRDRHSLGGSIGSVFTARGTLTVQIFCPTGKQGLVGPARLGKVLLDAFEGKRGGVVRLTKSTQREIGRDGTWFQVNVSARFAYDVAR